MYTKSQTNINLIQEETRTANMVMAKDKAHLVSFINQHGPCSHSFSLVSLTLKALNMGAKRKHYTHFGFRQG